MLMKREFFLIFLIVAALLLSGCTQPIDGNGGTGNGDNGDTGNGGGSVEAEKVKTGDNIAVEYRGTLEDGTQFDASEGRGPLEFTAGAGQMIKGFDAAVIGMELNQEKTVTMQPADAYGETDPAKIVEIPKTQIGDADTMQVGMSLTSSSGANGVVKEIKEDTIVIDFNHALAGKPLTFWIKVVRIN